MIILITSTVKQRADYHTDSANVLYILSDRTPPGQGASEQEPQNWDHSLCETPTAWPSQSPELYGGK